MGRYKNIISWSVLVACFLALVGFTVVQRSARICSKLNISIDTDGDLFFVTNEDVQNKIRKAQDEVVGKAVIDINIDSIERSVTELPEVKSVQAYLLVDGTLEIKVVQRRPIVRVMPAKGSGYYIDAEGVLMPLSKNYSARVFVVNGEFVQQFRNISMAVLAESDSLKALTMFDEIFELASFLDQNPFWKAQIQQGYVNENKEFELIPRIGNHNIELGNTTDLADKLNRLMVFYTEGLPYSDWNKYSKISLKFNNQVVCTLKDTPL